MTITIMLDWELWNERSENDNVTVQANYYQGTEKFGKTIVVNTEMRNQLTMNSNQDHHGSTW